MDDHPFSFEYDCSSDALFNHYSGRMAEVNPDISGIGVYIGFVGTALVALLLLIFNYLVAHDPAQSPFACCHQDSHRANIWKPNTVDIQFLAVFRKFTKIRKFKARNALVFNKTILDLCDIQMVTGHAILVSGFISLSEIATRIPANDWAMLAYTAWFSAVAHLSGLSVLRSPEYQHSLAKAARVVGMMSLLILMSVALVPTGYFNWFGHIERNPGTSSPGSYSAALPQSPAVCYFDIATAERLWSAGCEAHFNNCSNKAGPSPDYTPVDTPAMQAMVVGILALLFGFFNRCIKLYQPLSHWVHSRVRQPVSGILLYILGRLSRFVTKTSTSTRPMHYTLWEDLVMLPLVGVLTFWRWAVSFYSSMLFEVIWVVLVIFWGILKLTDIRKPIGSQAGHLRNSWTFGQLVAVALLASPIITLMGRFARLKSTRAREQCLISAQEPQIPNLNLNENDHLAVPGEFPTTASSSVYGDPEAPPAVETLTTGDQINHAIPFRSQSFNYCTTACILGNLASLCWTIAGAVTTNYGVQGVAPKSMKSFWIDGGGALWAITIGQTGYFAISLSIGTLIDSVFIRILRLRRSYLHAISFCYLGCCCVVQYPSHRLLAAPSRMELPAVVNHTILVALYYLLFIVSYLIAGLTVILVRKLKVCSSAGRSHKAH